MESCFKPSKLLLPGNEIDLAKWSVVACDQFTSQPEYWETVEKYIDNNPSMLELILPEIYLKESEKRIPIIHEKMKEYLKKDIFLEMDEESFILVVRKVEDGIRLGLVGLIDLENYDYSSNSNSLIRATEQTVISRIPPRVKIRQGANIESSHVMLLYDDVKKRIIEPLYEDMKAKSKPIYDFKLMMNGGRLQGFKLSTSQSQDILNKFVELQKECKDLVFAIGDGNHSLATAKACWETMKKSLSSQEQECHPNRYALVEVNNLHCEVIKFEPIHRVLFCVNFHEFLEYFKKALDEQNMFLEKGEEIVFLNSYNDIGYSIGNRGNRLPVEIVQKIIDDYMEKNMTSEIDYIHGEDVLRNIVSEKDAIGIKLGTIAKSALFPAIRSGGVLPRKTFSIGHANEKRYYMECRRINETPINEKNIE